MIKTFFLTAALAGSLYAMEMNNNDYFEHFSNKIHTIRTFKNKEKLEQNYEFFKITFEKMNDHIKKKIIGPTRLINYEDNIFQEEIRWMNTIIAQDHGKRDKNLGHMIQGFAVELEKIMKSNPKNSSLFKKKEAKEELSSIRNLSPKKSKEQKENTTNLINTIVGKCDGENIHPQDYEELKELLPKYVKFHDNNEKKAEEKIKKFIDDLGIKIGEEYSYFNQRDKVLILKAYLKSPQEKMDSLLNTYLWNEYGSTKKDFADIETRLYDHFSSEETQIAEEEFKKMNIFTYGPAHLFSGPKVRYPEVTEDQFANNLKRFKETLKTYKLAPLVDQMEKSLKDLKPGKDSGLIRMYNFFMMSASGDKEKTERVLASFNGMEKGNCADCARIFSQTIASSLNPLFAEKKEQTSVMGELYEELHLRLQKIRQDLLEKEIETIRLIKDWVENGEHHTYLRGAMFSHYGRLFGLDVPHYEKSNHYNNYVESYTKGHKEQEIVEHFFEEYAYEKIKNTFSEILKTKKYNDAVIKYNALHEIYEGQGKEIMPKMNEEDYMPVSSLRVNRNLEAKEAAYEPVLELFGFKQLPDIAKK